MKIAGHRVIVGRGDEEAAKRAVVESDRKHGDSYGNWGGWGGLGIFIAVQIDHGPQRTENAV